MTELGSSTDRTSGALRSLFLGSAMILFLFAAVLPNSFPLITAIFLGISALLATPLFRCRNGMFIVLIAYVASAIVTLLFLMVGHSAGAPPEAAPQVIVIYVISPFLWILVSQGLASSLSDAAIGRWIQLLTVLSIVSVGLYFYLFLFVDPMLASILTDKPNINISEGIIESRMHVYGSLLFVTTGFFASPTIVRGRIPRIVLLAALATTAVVSGRTSLVIAILIGLLAGITFELSKSPRSLQSIRLSKALPAVLLGLISIAGLTSVASSYGIEVSSVVESVLIKLAAGGGAARTEQLSALAEGITATYGLGAGHGVGVDYIRSQEFPWRYELVWVATIFRVGIIGALIYLVPFLIYGWFSFELWKRRLLTDLDRFLIAGFVGSFVASATNPYIEGFTFHWMFVFPFVHTIARMQERESMATEIQRHWLSKKSRLIKF